MISEKQINEKQLDEKSIKVDVATDRLVSEMAYFLRATKKSVLREAVADFAAARGRGTSLVADSRGETGGAPRAGDVDHEGEPRRAGGSASPVAHERFDQLPLGERLTLRRSELLRAFGEHGASNVRIMGPLAIGQEADEFELLAETDPVRGGESTFELEIIAGRLLGAPTTVLSSTALRLFNPAGLRRAVEESRPL
ncbi:hypothetical protein ASD23_13795 [Agromyces sp. Root1464]|uniref:hypothetical protein n=1 Tax=Agromyces sp. Root1464 TaxID=1736467 RepID=UPI00070193E0|nr:hypothetical protein [Agromyces sp. Root1464]KQZ09333.1 hypothetical protein ASD23_13795 [Agromyces sp. Root1464]